MTVWVFIALFISAIDVEAYDTKEACYAAAAKANAQRGNAWCTETKIKKGP